MNRRVDLLQVVTNTCTILFENSSNDIKSIHSYILKVMTNSVKSKQRYTRYQPYRDNYKKYQIDVKSVNIAFSENETRFAMFVQFKILCTCIDRRN